jgi:hypothetical protein
MIVFRRLWVALTVWMMLAGAAAAHTRSETHSNWRIVGRTVHLVFTVPDPEARRLSAAGAAAPRAVEDYLSRHVGARSEGQPCIPETSPEILSAVPGVSRFEFTFQCPSARKLAVWSSAFFDLAPTHTNFAQIQTDSGGFIEQLITKDHQQLDLEETSGSELKNANFFKYVELGVLHIFTGPDHQAFLVGLVLLSRHLKDLAFVITGFTVGHSITLALAVTGLLRPHGEYIDALIGLTIALVGTELVAENTHDPRLVAAVLFLLLVGMAGGRLLGWGGLPVLLSVGAALFSASYLMIAGRLRDAARLRLMVTMVFGLIHGFGFAAGLLELKLPPNNLAQMLFGFNVGVEIGQLTLVLAVLGAAALLVRVGLGAPRRTIADLAAAALVAVGFFWFFSRSYA